MTQKYGELTFTWTGTTLEKRFGEAKAFRVDVFEDGAHAGHWFLFDETPPVSQGVYLHESFRGRGIAQALAATIVADYSCPISVISGRIRLNAKSFFDRLEQTGYVTII